MRIRRWDGGWRGQGAALAIVVALPIASIGHPKEARADGSQRATAEALLDHGTKLMAAGDYLAACAKLSTSERLSPGTTTSLLLADCYERSGLTASAWAEYRAATSLAIAEHLPTQEATARERARALQDKLSYLTINAVPSPALRVKRDGVLLDEAIFGTPIPIDPGRHVVEASAPGKQQVVNSFEVGAAPSQISVVVPSLVDLDNPTVYEQRAPTTSHTSTQRTIGIGLGVLGGVGIATATFLAVRARSEWADLESACPGHVCRDQAEVDRLSTVRTMSQVATASLLVGLAGLGGGAALYFTAHDSPEERRVSLRVSPGAVSLAGSF